MRPAALILALAVQTANAQQPLTLERAVEIAQARGLAATSARSARDAARARDRAFNARLLPQLALSGNALDVNRGINPITLPDGSSQFIRQSQNQSQLGLAVTQKLPWTGSELSIGSQLSRIDLFGNENAQYWQTTPLVIGLTQQLFRPRTLMWDERQQSLTASLAERQYLESREDLASSTASAYFDLWAADVALRNATTNAAVNDTLYTLNKGRYEVGKIGENDLLQSELALLRARTAVDAARLDRDRAEAALRRLLDLRLDEPIALDPPKDAPALAVDTATAMAQALRNASASDQMELQMLQARRHVTEARLGNTFGATIQAMVGFNQTAPVFNQAYQSLLNKQKLTVGVQMPMFQWGGGRADVEAARADESKAVADARARREALQEEARFAARQIGLAQRVLAISAKADTVASKRFDVAKARYVIGKIGISDLYIGQNEKDQAVTAYVAALRGYWTAYYRLRRVTLWDFAAGRAIE